MKRQYEFKFFRMFGKNFIWTHLFDNTHRYDLGYSVVQQADRRGNVTKTLSPEKWQSHWGKVIGGLYIQKDHWLF